MLIIKISNKLVAIMSPSTMLSMLTVGNHTVGDPFCQMMNTQVHKHTSSLISEFHIYLAVLPCV